MFETLLHISCKGSNSVEFQYYQSIEQTGKATVLRIFELIDYKSLSISTKYQHLNSYENIFSSLVHIMD